MLTAPAAVDESDLLAYVDGRLEARRRAEVEHHLCACPDDATRIAWDLVIQEALRLLFRKEQ